MAYRVRNIGRGPQGIHTNDRGLVFIPAGEERTIDPVDLGRVRSLPFFEVEELDAKVPAPPAEIAESIAKFDHDGDGKPGGSKKAATKRPAKRRKRRPKAKP